MATTAPPPRPRQGAGERVAVLAVVPGTRGSSSPVYVRDLRAAAALAQRGHADDEPDEAAGDHMHQFVLFASLDIVADRAWTQPACYLGEVDSFRDTTVSAWVAHSGEKILCVACGARLVRGRLATDAPPPARLLHRGFNEPSVRALLRAVNAIWIKVNLNPLRKRDAPLVDPNFDDRVLAAAYKCIGSGLSPS